MAVIEADLALRPALRPWVAALWVAPDARRRGLGVALGEAAVARAFDLGEAAIHLYAGSHLRPFYQPRWVTLESGVGPKGVDIYVRRA
jgi:GNAT superfamily N-acetyltransferase